MTWYITISSEGYVECLESAEAVRFLEFELNVSKDETGLTLVSRDSVNSFSIVLANANERGSYSLVDRLPEQINLIELICWNDSESAFYEGIAVKIANHFNWCARVENSDDERLICAIRNRS